MFLHISALKDAGLQDAPEGSTIHREVGQGRKGIQVVRVITLDTSTATASTGAAGRSALAGTTARSWWPRQLRRRAFGASGRP